MLQLIAQRDGFVFTNPPKLIPSIATLLKNQVGVLDGIEQSEWVNLYYTLAHHNGADKSAQKPVRSASTFDNQTVIPFDIDKGVDTSRAMEYAAAIAQVLAIPITGCIVINSGNGVHVLVSLKNPIRSAKYFKDNRDYYAAICDKVGEALKAKGLPYGKMDTTCFEPARVFRMPGTINRKPGLEDKRCELVQYSPDAYDLDLRVVSGLGDLEKQNVSPQEIRRQYPRPDLPEMVKECRFVAWALESPTEVHEPHAFDLFSLLAAQPASAKVDWKGASTDAIGLARSVFDKASASQSLARTEFETKWEQSSKYGVRTCATINDRWGKCRECPHFSRIKTPLALKSKEHIGSEAMGYWVLNSNGAPSYPHYEDLSKVYQREHSYITTAQERLFAFTETHYTETSPLLVKSWLERKVTPTEPLREVHRNEFVQKVKVVGALSGEAETTLFEQGIRGKLNCRNGVLDLLKGELLPHSPQLGFQYVLPYDYEPGQASEFFVEWLETVTQQRVELMESLMDIMAYALWPSYDDHMFAYFTGEGKNGKSTLIELIQAIVGKRNYSSVSLEQLAHNRFAPAALEGKLVNLCEEAGGNELSVAHLNVIKTLSAGGELFVEQKNKQGFNFKNSAKLIFSANRVPRFKEQGVAIQRRLLVIPFDHAIADPDERVKHKLIAEVPAILSMLVRRIQDNVKKHGGRFMVYRGGQTAATAQKYFLTAGNNVVEWASQSIVSSSEYSDDQYIAVQEAYARYSAWARENGFSFVENKVRFGSILREFVVTKAAIHETPLIVQGKAIRVYRRTRFKTEAECPA